MKDFKVAIIGCQDDTPSWISKVAEEDIEYIFKQDFCRTIMIVKRGDEIVLYSDGGEPEDQTFDRDWAWVAEELQKAYELGVENGKEEEREKGCLEGGIGGLSCL